MRVERSVSIHDQTIKGTKTDEERTVELSEKTTSMLKTHLWLHDTAIRATGYLFTSETGAFLDHNNVAKYSAKLSHFSLDDLPYVRSLDAERGRTAALRQRATRTRRHIDHAEVLRQADATFGGPTGEPLGFGTNLEPIPASW